MGATRPLVEAVKLSKNAEVLSKASASFIKCQKLDKIVAKIDKIQKPLNYRVSKQLTQPAPD